MADLIEITDDERERLREVERERDHERRVANSAFGKAEQYLQASKLLEQERDQARSELTTLREAVGRHREWSTRGGREPDKMSHADRELYAALASLDEKGAER